MLVGIRHTAVLILGCVLLVLGVIACGGDATQPLPGQSAGRPAFEPKNAGALFDRGTDYLEKGEYEKAIQDYDEAILLDPLDAITYSNRGSAYYNLGQHERAIQDYDEAILLDPLNAIAYYFRGLIYGELGKSDEAARDFAKAKELGFEAP